MTVRRALDGDGSGDVSGSADAPRLIPVQPETLVTVCSGDLGNSFRVGLGLLGWDFLLKLEFLAPERSQAP